MIRFKRNKKIICVLIFSVFIVLVFSAKILDMNGEHKEDFEEKFKAEINVVIPEKIYVVNDAVVEWMSSTETAKEIYDTYRQYGRLDYTQAFNFFYSIDNLPINCKIENQHVSIVDKDYSKEVFSQSLSAEKTSVFIQNLRPDTNYEYLIQVAFSNGKKIEKSGTFKTEPSLCFLFVDGARNVRDIGTTETLDGKRIKKYMVYRGSEIDGAINQSSRLTEDGINYMTDVLKIKTEVDLRWYDKKIMKDVLGSGTVHNYYRISSYNDFFDKTYSVEDAKKLFSDLANPDTYPIYVHCSYGADRTGTVIYFLEALLGVSEEKLHQEWESSVLCNGDTFYEEMDEFLIRFKALKGDTMQEKAENYLLSIGVTRKEIESIKEILLTD